MAMSARLSEIARRLADAASAPLEPLPVDITKSCWVVPGKCVAASRELAHLYRHAEDDLEYLIEMVRK